MKDIRLFVASSKELERERNELAYLMLAKEEEFAARGLRVRLAKWEYVDLRMTEARTEDRYLDEMYDCDAAFVLFRAIAGISSAEMHTIFSRKPGFSASGTIEVGSSGNLVEMALWGGMGLLCMDMQRGTLRSPPNRVPGHVLRTAQGPSVRMCAPCPVVEKKHHGLDDRSSNLL